MKSAGDVIMPNATSLTRKRSDVCGTTVSRGDDTNGLLTIPVRDDLRTPRFPESSTSCLLCFGTQHCVLQGLQQLHTSERTLFAVHVQISWQWSMSKIPQVEPAEELVLTAGDDVTSPPSIHLNNTSGPAGGRHSVYSH